MRTALRGLLAALTLTLVLAAAPALAADAGGSGDAAGSLVTLALIGFAALGTIRAGTAVDGGTLYRPAFHSPVESVPTRIDPSTFKGTDWVDADGVLKPGAPIQANGALAGTSGGQSAARVVPFGVGIAASNSNADLDAAPNGDVAAATRGDIVREHVEAALGRALTTNEVNAIEETGLFVLV